MISQLKKETFTEDIGNILKHLPERKAFQGIKFAHGIGRKKLNYRKGLNRLKSFEQGRNDTMRITNSFRVGTAILNQI